MPIPCHIEVEGVTFKPRKPYIFIEIPRIGERVALEWDGDRYPLFIVYDVQHVPEGMGEEGPAGITLFVRKLDSHA